MNKKGVELGINTVVVFILALLVLVFFSYILSSQFQSKTKAYKHVTEEFEKDIKTRAVCEEIFSTKRCLPLETCNALGLINLGVDWKDCKDKATPGHTLYCCK